MPCCASFSAVARPIPLVPPVMSAVEALGDMWSLLRGFVKPGRGQSLEDRRSRCANGGSGRQDGAVAHLVFLDAGDGGVGVLEREALGDGLDVVAGGGEGRRTAGAGGGWGGGG